jgi:UDP-N-acetylglucosamine 2-epimerase (non-hydrolysing)
VLRLAGRPLVKPVSSAVARVALVVGTRPEAIKLAPVYHALERVGVEPVIILTGQHDELLDPHIRHFGLGRRLSLAAREEGDCLGTFAGRCIQRLAGLFSTEQFDAVLVQGDTGSALAGALAAALARLPLGHVEAGLRTGDLDNPFPEELNRQLIARAVQWHFAPTPAAMQNLVRERVAGDIRVVGNTVVDAARWTATNGVTREILHAVNPALGQRPHVLVTAHRRENFGAPMRRIASAIASLAARYRATDFIVPVHPNPEAGGPLAEALGGISNVRLVGALSYPATIGLLASAFAVLTDSGGLQEEAPGFGVPVLVLRDVTERPEGIAAGCSRLVGCDPDRIIAAFDELVGAVGPAMITNPYGDGFASDRIASFLTDALAARQSAC